jgi:hypothetical protein
MNVINDRDDAMRTAQSVLQKDRRRIRVLAGITVGLWVAALLVIPAFYFPLAAKVKQHAGQLTHRAADGTPITAQDVANNIAPLAEMAAIVAGVMMGLALLTEVLAAISTVALALTIRRVTLQQVTAGLSEISEQLRLLREARAGG